MQCRLCKNRSAFIHPKLKEFYQCPDCLLLFKAQEYFLSPDQEKARYLNHHNDYEDPHYCNFLNQLAKPLQKYLTNQDHCLDFGCGPNPVMEKLFFDSGFSMKSYDPIFYPKLQKERFQAISANEVVEHFYNPFESLEQICNLLDPKGHLALGTSCWNDELDLYSWYYLKDPTHVCCFHHQTLTYLSKILPLQLMEKANERVYIFQRL